MRTRNVRTAAVSISFLALATTGTSAGEVPFTEHVISIAADGATSVFAADIDGDGDVDVLSSSAEDDKIAWYENDGGAPPIFTERVISTNADSTQSVFAADVDRDGDVDVLSASVNDDKIAWYENDGGSPPGFTERVISLTADGARTVFAADVDGDGDVDVLSSSANDDKVAWYENDGGSPPMFTEDVITTGADAANSVHAADIDRDGDIDVLSTSFLDNRIVWYENVGAMEFSARDIPTTADTPQSVSVADVDRDGDMDVLSASSGDNTIAWYENDGGSPPGFTERVISTMASAALSVFAADVDRDGDIDVLSASAGDDTVAWYDNDGGSPPTFTERVISTGAANAGSVFVADVDGDGDLDVLSASFVDDKIAWYENGSVLPEEVPFTERIISTVGDRPSSALTADVDGDGDNDVVSGFFTDGRIAWFENDGGSPPRFTERVISTASNNVFFVSAADVDGDGDTDVLAAWFFAKIAWYENDGGSPPSFVEHVISTAADGATSVFAANIDGDGDVDVLSASRLDDKIAWYENDGGSPPMFTERVISTGADRAQSVFAADVDGDGDTDVLSASAHNDTIAWYENNGESPPAFTERAISTTRDEAQSVFAADVDRDGDIDVLSASQNDSTIAWYENDGGSPPVFAERVISTDALAAQSVFAVDVDGDGDTDVLSASFSDAKVAWYENDGASPPVFTERVISTAALRALSVFAADVDGDGDVDVLSASDSGADHKITWYENSGGDIIFEAPLEFEAVGEATIEAVGNLDTELSAAPGVRTPDVIVLVPGPDPGEPGQAQVFRNPAGDGNLTANDPIATGASPSGVDVGRFNGDLFLDVALCNAFDGTVVVYTNDGGGLGGFPVAQTVFTLPGGDPRAIATGDFDRDGDADLAVAFDGDGTVRLLFGDGNLNFSNDTTFTGGVGMVRQRPGDMDNDKDLDLVTTSRDDNTMRLFVLADGIFVSSQTLPVGLAPVDVALGDFDQNGFLDIVSADNGDATLSVILNSGGGVFQPRFTVSTGENPLSVHAVDLDDDTDLDLAVVATVPQVGRAVQVFENNTIDGLTPPGGRGSLTFAPPLAYSVDADPNFVAGGDFNVDGVSDLVTANEDDGGTDGSVTVLLTIVPQTACGPDIDGSGAVDFADILAILSAWGNAGGPEDLDDSGTVDFGDLLVVLGNWGPCA